MLNFNNVAICSNVSCICALCGKWVNQNAIEKFITFLFVSKHSHFVIINYCTQFWCVLKDGKLNAFALICMIFENISE